MQPDGSLHCDIVFVLGAGASDPYGLPIGSKLAEAVVDGWETTTDHSLKNLLAKAGVHPTAYCELARKLQHGDYPSVDSLLEDNPNLEEAGKIAIAAILLRRERDAKLFHPKPPGHWYGYLRDYALDPHPKLRAGIITFNYDRTLEHYLLSTLREREGNGDDATRLLSRIPIIHVHGTLGPVTSGIPHKSNDVTPEEAREAATSIDIVRDAASESPAFKTARGLVAEAPFVFFCGFGFHRRNMERLLSPEERRADLWNSKALLGATFVGMGERARRQIRSDFFGDASTLVDAPSIDSLLADRFDWRLARRSPRNATDPD